MTLPGLWFSHPTSAFSAKADMFSEHAGSGPMILGFGLMTAPARAPLVIATKNARLDEPRYLVSIGGS
jgi:hypothetical protein